MCVQNRAAAPYVNMMKKGEDAAVSVRKAVAGLWRKGAALAWDVPSGPVAGMRHLSFPCEGPLLLSPRQWHAWSRAAAERF